MTTTYTIPANYTEGYIDGLAWFSPRYPDNVMYMEGWRDGRNHLYRKDLSGQ